MKTHIHISYISFPTIHVCVVNQPTFATIHPPPGSYVHSLPLCAVLEDVHSTLRCLPRPRDRGILHLQSRLLALTTTTRRDNYVHIDVRLALRLAPALPSPRIEMTSGVSRRGFPSDRRQRRSAGRCECVHIVYTYTNIRKVSRAATSQTCLLVM